MNSDVQESDVQKITRILKLIHENRNDTDADTSIPLCLLSQNPPSAVTEPYPVWGISVTGTGTIVVQVSEIAPDRGILQRMLRSAYEMRV